MDLKNHIIKIIDHCNSFAKEMLNEKEKEFFPFGVIINNTNELIPIAANPGKNDSPESQDVIDFLKDYFKQEFDSNKIKAFAIAYDVIVTDPENGRKSDALLVDMTHKEDINIPVYYFPYSWNSDDDLIFGKSYGIKR
jgi:hypothetical protein